MKCPGCRHDNKTVAVFCEECGSKLALGCSNCGTELNLTAKFCLKCGTPTAPAAEPIPARRVADYTPKHLADKILQSKSALEGERKQVTVLFADVKGSMELAEQLDPEQWHDILDRFFQILSDGVHRFEGTVNQYTGDGIMALFGAPIAHEDHAQRACYASLHLREEIVRYAAEVKTGYGIVFAIRMGLNSGEVVVGKIGDDLRMDYTAQGHTVGLAQRMEGLAGSNMCYLTAATAALLGGYFALDDLGDFSVKGVAAPVRVHGLSGIGESRTRLDTARTRGLSCFVGRDADLRTLEDALAEAAAGNGQVVGVVAEAGTGKSRLCYEFLEQCRAGGLQVFEARAVAHGRNVPLLPILELFRAYFGITPGDSDGATRDKISDGYGILDRHDANALPLLFDFLGVADPQHPGPKLEPNVRQSQLMELMRQLVHASSAARATVTLIEDLHWLDAASAEFLKHMVDARANSRSLLLLNFRPEYHAEWMQKLCYRRVSLAPLGSQAVAELLADLLGHDPSLRSLAALIQERTGGNPFFTEEVTQSLVESDHLKGKRGAYQLVKPIGRFEVPATVQAVLAARIDRLPEREKRLLQIAAVIGKDFQEPLLMAVAEMAIDELKVALAALRAAGFIHEQVLYPVAEYAFKHPLTQEVALGSQLRGRRRLLHAAVAHAIELQDAAHLDERAALLAHHWEEAGEALDAARWHRRAAERVGLTDFTAATHHWERVRVLLRGLPVGGEAATLGIDACTQLLSLSLRINTGLDEARSLLEEGQALANAIGDRRAHLNLSQVYGFALNSAGDMAAYLELTIENQRAALEIDDTGVQANAWMYLVDALGHAGRLTEALQLADEGLARFPRDLPAGEWTGGLNPYCLFSLWRGCCLGWMGRMADGIEELDRCRCLAEQDGTLEMAGYAIGMIAEVCYYAHDVEKASESARRVAEISRELDQPPNMVAVTQLASGDAHLAAGQGSDAVPLARAALYLHGREENEMTGWSATQLADALLAAGELSAAEDATANAIKLCQRSNRTVYEAVAHSIMARVLLRRDGVAARTAIEAALDNAAQLVERTGASSLTPALLEWRAEFAASLGDHVTSEQLLLQAEIDYEQIGAPKHAERLAFERQANSA